MFRLAQVSDPHFRSFAGAELKDFAGKRAVGMLNLMINRRRRHRMELLAALADDLRAASYEHLAVTGDLTNLSLRSEMTAARRWIDGLALPAERATVIPGNHDAYVEEAVSGGWFEEIFAPFQSAELRSPGQIYPFVRLREGVALLALNTGVPSMSLGGWGEVGPEQLARLEALLGAPDLRGLVRVLLLHHPPVMQKGGEDRSLRDRASLLALLARTGVDLVIHGHDHRDERTDVAGPGGSRIPVVGAGSASYAGAPERRARYNVYEIQDRRITLVIRSHDESSGQFREVRREPLA